MARSRKTKSKPKRRNAAGHLSGFESQVAAVLDEQSVEYDYETIKLLYRLPSPEHRYTPDFTTGDIIIEAKGYFPYLAQVKMRAVKECNPDKDIRFVFMYPHKLLPQRKITHAEWAVKEGFMWTDLAGLAKGDWYPIDSRVSDA